MNRFIGIRNLGSGRVATRWLAVIALAVGLWAVGGSQARAQTYHPTNCPAGQIPAFSGGGCVLPQQNPSLSGYGLTSQGSILPESGLNGAPAIQRCNGTPVPFGKPCPGTVVPATTASGQNGAGGHSPNNPYGISISLPPSTSNFTVTPPVPYAPPATAAPATTSSVATASPPTVALTPPSDPTAALQGLLGDWYSSWISYAAMNLNLSDAQTAQIAAYLASLTPCATGQKDACQTFVYQQLLFWLNQPPAASTSGS